MRVIFYAIRGAVLTVYISFVSSLPGLFFHQCVGVVCLVALALALCNLHPTVHVLFLTTLFIRYFHGFRLLSMLGMGVIYLGDDTRSPSNRLVILVRSPHGCSAPVLHGLFCAYLAFTRSFRSCLLPQIIMFSDLECDYINPIDLCNKLNQVSCTQALWSLTYARILHSLSCPKT